MVKKTDTQKGHFPYKLFNWQNLRGLRLGVVYERCQTQVSCMPTSVPTLNKAPILKEYGEGENQTTNH